VSKTHRLLQSELPLRQRKLGLIVHELVGYERFSGSRRSRRGGVGDCDKRRGANCRDRSTRPRVARDSAPTWSFNAMPTGLFHETLRLSDLTRRTEFCESHAPRISYALGDACNSKCYKRHQIPLSLGKNNGTDLLGRWLWGDGDAHQGDKTERGSWTPRGSGVALCDRR
jgi:hypothetical protein